MSAAWSYDEVDSALAAAAPVLHAVDDAAAVPDGTPARPPIELLRPGEDDPTKRWPHVRKPGPRTVSAAELLAEPDPDVDWLVDGLYPASGVVLQAGDPKSFKTLLALQVAVVVGHPGVDHLFGREVRHGPVLFVEEEGSRHKLRERIGMMLRGLGVDEPPDLHLSLHESVRLDDEKSLFGLRSLVAQMRPVLVVLDPLVMLHSGDENKASDMGRIMRGLITIASESECCVLVVHHVNKPSQERKPTRAAQRLRGSSAFAGATDANLIMDRDGDRTVRIRAEYRDAEPSELYLELDVETLLLSPAEPPESSLKVPRDDLMAFVRQSGQAEVKAVADRFGATRVTARNALEAAVDAGFLDKAEGRNRTVRYFPVEVVNDRH